MTMEKDALENLEVTVTVCFFFPDGTCGVVRARVRVRVRVRGRVRVRVRVRVREKVHPRLAQGVDEASDGSSKEHVSSE